MAENTGIETIHDDDLTDDALDRGKGEKLVTGGWACAARP